MVSSTNHHVGAVLLNSQNKPIKPFRRVICFSQKNIDNSRYRYIIYLLALTSFRRLSLVHGIYELKRGAGRRSPVWGVKKGTG